MQNFQNYHDAFQIDVENRPETFPMSVAEIKNMEKQQQETKDNMEHDFQANLDIDEIYIEDRLAEIAKNKNLNSKKVELIQKIKKSTEDLNLNLADDIIDIDPEKYKNFNALCDCKILEEKDNLFETPLKYVTTIWSKEETKAILVSISESL